MVAVDDERVFLFWSWYFFFLGGGVDVVGDVGGGKGVVRRSLREKNGGGGGVCRVDNKQRANELETGTCCRKEG